MLYRVEIRKKDGSVQYYGLKQGTVYLEATSSGGFKTAYEVFRCVEAELRDDPTVDYALSFGKLKENGFLCVSDTQSNGDITPVLMNAPNLRVIIYCEDPVVKASSKSSDYAYQTPLKFDENAFADAWEIARTTPRTTLWKSLLLNPSTWYMSATLAVVIATLISFFNPEAFVQALPYLAIAAPALAGFGVLMLLVSTLYAVVSEIKDPNQPNPVINYLRERAEWIRHNPVKSGLILGIGSVVLLAGIILTVGYFTHGFGLFPVDSFEFMHVIFDFITKLFATGISYLSALTGLGVTIPEASITSFALTASAVAFVTSIFWTFDTTLRLAHTATDLTMPPRIKTPEAASTEQQTKNPARKDPALPANNKAANPVINPESPAPTATNPVRRDTQTPAPSDPRPQTNSDRPQQSVLQQQAKSAEIPTPLQFPSVPTRDPAPAATPKPYRPPMLITEKQEREKNNRYFEEVLSDSDENSAKQDDAFTRQTPNPDVQIPRSSSGEQLTKPQVPVSDLQKKEPTSWSFKWPSWLGGSSNPTDLASKQRTDDQGWVEETPELFDTPEDQNPTIYTDMWTTPQQPGNQQGSDDPEYDALVAKWN